MSHPRYILGRIIQTIVILWIIATLLFLLFRMMPGSIVDRMAFAGADAETIQAIKNRWALDQPLYIQYIRYLDNLLHFEAGTSLRYKMPVWEYTKDKIFNSIILVAPGITAAYIIGTIAGGFAGIKRGSLFEKYGILPPIIAGTFPEFFTSIVLIIIFAVHMGWFPPTGMVSPAVVEQFADASWWRIYLTGDFWLHYVLPFLAVVLRSMYIPALIMRTNVVNTMNQDYIYYARMLGLKDAIRYKDILKHSILPVITLYPVSMTRAIGGLVLIETVFNWPGIGDALIQAVINRDYPVIQFVFLLAAAFVVIGNFVVDIVYSWIDPRITK